MRRRTRERLERLEADVRAMAPFVKATEAAIADHEGRLEPLEAELVRALEAETERVRDIRDAVAGKVQAAVTQHREREHEGAT